MMRFRAAGLLILGIGLLLGQAAFAQGADGSVVVLKFTQTGVEQEVMDQFYLELHEVIRAHPSMKITAGGEVTIDDLILMAGCAEPTADCLAGLQDFIEGNRIVFGSVDKNADLYSFAIRVFDFPSGAFLDDGSVRTLQGDGSWIRRGMTSVIEGVFYGDVGQVSVVVEGASSAHVLIDGVERGMAPLSLSELALGEVDVTVRSETGQEKTERLLLRHNRTEDLRVRFEATDLGAPVAARSGNPYLLSAIAVAAVGVAGIVVGFVGQTQLSALESDAGALVGGRTALREDEVSRAASLQDDMNGAHTLRVIGFSAGGVALAAGAGLFYKALAGNPDAAPPSVSLQEGLKWNIGTTGFAVGGSF